MSPALTTNTNFYKYEPFVYTFTGGSSFSVSGSSILTAFCTATESNVVFASVNGFQSTGSSGGESLVVRSSIGSNAYTFFINAGRFVSQVSPVVPIPTALSLFFGEPASIPFYPAPGGSVTVTTAYQTPTLPIGMSFSDVSTNWVLSGTPRLTSATSNYLFVGSNSAGQVISSSLTIGVAPERMTLTTSSSNQTLITSPPTAITPITLSNGTGNSSFISTVVFTLPALPDGLNYYSNAVPNLITTSIFTAPLGTTVVIAGTPTVSNVSSSNVTLVITTSGFGGGGVALYASAAVTFTYSPTILFTLPAQTSNTFYVGVPVSNTLSTTYGLQINAYTAFSSTLQPVIAYSPTSILPGVNIISNSSGWYISGTPTSAGSVFVTIYASNAAGLVGSNALTFTVENPVINISATTGLQSFVVGRPLSNSFTYGGGSYVYPITYTITSPAYQTTGWLASNNLAFSNLPAGLSNTLAPVGAGYEVTLIGIPTATASAAQVTLRATVGAVFGLGSVVALVNPDVFTFSTPTPMPFVFSQNIPITPIQMFVSTLSETPVLYFTGEGLPTGLSITSTGSLQGTPLVATLVGTGSGFGFLSPGADYVTFSATNGYTTTTPLSTQFPYKTIADSFNIVSNSVLITAGTAVNIPILYSMPSGLNNAVVSYPSNQPYLYGLGVTGSSTSNALTGTLSNGVWPNFIVQSPGPVVLTASSTVGGLTSVSTAPISLLVGTNTQDIIRYVVGLNAARTTCTVYSASNSFDFLNIVYTGPTSGYVDMQPLRSSALGADCKYIINTGCNSKNGTYAGVSDTYLPSFGYAGLWNIVAASFSLSISYCIYLTPSNMPSSYNVPGSNTTLGMAIVADPTLGANGSWLSNVDVLPNSDGRYVLRWLPQSNDSVISMRTGGISSAGYLSLSAIPPYTYQPIVQQYPGCAILLAGTARSTCSLHYGYIIVDGIYQRIAPLSNSTCTMTTVNDIETHGYPTFVAVGIGANTIQISSGRGSVWSNVTNPFTQSGTNVVWGGYSNASGFQSIGWIATGLNTGGVPSVKFSSNAVSWIDIPFAFTVGTTVGPLQFDGSFWNILVNTTTVYRHGLDASSITDTSSWTSNTVSYSGSNPSSMAAFAIPAYGPIPTSPVTMTYSTALTGPTFTLPSATTYLILQYVPITPVLFDAYASDVASVYYLGSTLPRGMVWSPRTPSSNGQYYIGSISGLGVNVGTFPVDVYARNSAGTTKITVTFIISRPFPTLSRNTGSAYTAFTREKVIADAETNATDNHVHPYSVGQFLLDRPPDETTAPPVCFQPDTTFLQQQRDAATAAESSALASVLAYRTIAEAAAATAASTTSIPVAQTASNAAAAAAASAAAIAAEFTSSPTIVAASAQTAPYAAQAAASLANLQAQKSAWASAGVEAVVTTVAGILSLQNDFIVPNPGGGQNTWPLYNAYTYGTTVKLFRPLQPAVLADGKILFTSPTGNSFINMPGPETYFNTLDLTTGACVAFAKNAQPDRVASLSSNLILASYTGTSAIYTLTYPGGIRTLLAGGNSIGYENGVGASAKFNNPVGIVADSNSNIYVADKANHTIRKITYPGGVVTKIAGGDNLQTTATGSYTFGTGLYTFGMTSNPGFSNGMQLQLLRESTFSYPPTGTVTNIVGLSLTLNITFSLSGLSGSGLYVLATIPATGSTDGVGSNIRFNLPTDISITSSGVLVVADRGNSSIRLVTPSAGGTIWTSSTIASGIPFDNYTYGLGVLPISNTIVYTISHVIKFLTLSGSNWITTTRAGNYNVPVPGNSPSIVGIDGTATLANPANATFNYIFGLAVIPSTGQIVISDSQDNAIRLMSPSV